MTSKTLGVLTYVLTLRTGLRTGRDGGLPLETGGGGGGGDGGGGGGVGDPGHRGVGGWTGEDWGLDIHSIVDSTWHGEQVW